MLCRWTRHWWRGWCVGETEKRPGNFLYIHTYIHTIHTYIYAYMHTCLHTYIIPTYIHTYILTCIHTSNGRFISNNLSINPYGWSFALSLRSSAHSSSSHTLAALGCSTSKFQSARFTALRHSHTSTPALATLTLNTFQPLMCSLQTRSSLCSLCSLSSLCSLC